MMCDTLSSILSFLTVPNARWSIAQLGEDSSLQCSEGTTACCILVNAGQIHLTTRQPGREDQTIELSAGDIALVLNSTDSTISDRPVPRKNRKALSNQSGPDRVSSIDIGSQRARALVTVGCFEIEPRYTNLLTRYVPEMVKINGDHGRLPVWTGVLGEAQALECAAQGVGWGAFAKKLAETCITQVIRIHRIDQCRSVEQEGDKDVSPKILRALQLINAQPTTNWTVGSLAREVGMSRSSFSDMFGRSIGESPVRHLARVRMKIAAQMLHGEHMTLLEIAYQVGYSSDISLTRAFKRFFGTTPSEFRRRSSVDELAPVTAGEVSISHPLFLPEKPATAYTVLR